MTYQVHIMNMDKEDSNWIVIDLENIDTILSERLIEYIGFDESLSELDQAIAVAKSIHELYDDFHSLVIDSNGKTHHHFILETVDIMDKNWLEHLSQSHYIGDEAFDKAIEHYSAKNLRNTFEKVFPTKTK